MRRELATNGRNRIFVNNQLVTQSFLKKIGVFLVDIHGQGEQATLFNPATHLEMLDEYANLQSLRKNVAEKYRELAKFKRKSKICTPTKRRNLQLLDILQFQVDEIKKVNPQVGEEDALEEEKRRLNNVEKLSTLSDEAISLLYENEEATISTLEKAAQRITELAEYESSFREYTESLQSAQAVLEDLAFSVRDFRGSLEFSPERLEEIENRLAEIARLKRKYGGTIETVLEHFAESEERLKNIETAELREKELNKKLQKARERIFDYRLRNCTKSERKRRENLKRKSKQILKAVVARKSAF